VDDHYALPAPGPAPEQEAGASEERDLVWTAAQSLEPRQALILDMAVRQQLTSSDRSGPGIPLGPRGCAPQPGQGGPRRRGHRSPGRPPR
jgi:hypothetical protein